MWVFLNLFLETLVLATFLLLYVIGKWKFHGSPSNPEFPRWNPMPSLDSAAFALWTWATTSWQSFTPRPSPCSTSLCGSSTWAEPSTTTRLWWTWPPLSAGAPWGPWEDWTFPTTASSIYPHASSPTWPACSGSSFPTIPWWPSTTPPSRVWSTWRSSTWPSMPSRRCPRRAWKSWTPCPALSFCWGKTLSRASVESNLLLCGSTDHRNALETLRALCAPSQPAWGTHPCSPWARWLWGATRGMQGLTLLCRPLMSSWV